MEGNSERDLSLKSREVDEPKSAEPNLYSNTEQFNLYSIPQIPIQEEEEEDDDSDEVRSGGQENAGKRMRSAHASPKVIQWLQENYEPYEGSSLPRSSIYSTYQTFCTQNSLEAVNPASFGKLIRSLFPDLKTRRLGTRGNSKYHYYGIRIKETSELKGLSYNSDEQTEERAKTKKPKKDSETKPSKYEPEASGPLGSSINLPEFLLPELSLPPEVNMSIVRSFFESYRIHCQSLVDTIHKHKFSDIQQLLYRFWTQTVVNTNNFLRIPDIIEQIIEKDHITYKAMATVLLPNVLQALPVSIPQSIRDFSRHLEGWLQHALENLPPYLLTRKLAVAKKFAQSLNKQASLNHLTQAARAVLQNPNQLTQMIVDWNRLDFEFIKDQASWVCACSEQTTGPRTFYLHPDIIALEEFKRLLNERITLEQWASWLSDLISRFIGSDYLSRNARRQSKRSQRTQTKFASLVTQQPQQILPPQFSMEFPQQKHHPEYHGVERFVMQNEEKSVHTDEDYAVMMSNIQSMNRNFHKVPSLGVDDMNKLNQYVGTLPERVGSPTSVPLQLRPDMLPKRTHEPLKPNMMFPQQANQLGILQGISPFFDPRLHYDPAMYQQQIAQLATLQMQQKHNGN